MREIRYKGRVKKKQETGKPWGEEQKRKKGSGRSYRGEKTASDMGTASGTKEEIRTEKV